MSVMNADARDSVMPPDVAERTRLAYHAASDSYDDPALAFWDRFGRTTIERIGLSPGMRVLDAACGSGASALPAAEHVGPAGRVLGVDLAEGLLALGRAKAERQGLANVEFRCGDFLALPAPPESFDAVVCVFGIFFVPDMAGAARALWRMVKPGGTLAVTTWGPRMFEPANGIFWDAIGAERPDLVRSFNPWERTGTPSVLEAVLVEGGVAGVTAVAEAGTHPLRSPEDWWAIVMGSGYRGTMEQLDADARERVRSRVLDEVRRRNVSSIEANVVYALARKA